MEHGALTISGIKIKGLVYSLFYKFGEDWFYLKNYEKNPVKKMYWANFLLSLSLLVIIWLSRVDRWYGWWNKIHELRSSLEDMLTEFVFGYGVKHREESKNDIQGFAGLWVAGGALHLENRGDFREERRNSFLDMVYSRWYLLFNITILYWSI